MNHLKSGNAYFGQGSYKNNKYNGKELQETGMYSYGWREYMPDIARWNGIDQLAENYFSTSPYAYVLNNPINMFDPDGRKNEAWLADAPEWLQEMWNATPDGTNSYWTNSGSSAGGGGGHFVYTGGTAGLGAGYGIGSTLDFAGNFNSQYGTVTNGVLNYTYWTNAEGAKYGQANFMKLNLNSSSMISNWNPTKTTTFAEVTSLIMENPFIKAENTMYHTKGKAGVSNIDYRKVRNSNTGSLNGLLSLQLNLSSLNIYNELTSGSDTSGFMLSIGDYSFGGSGTLSFDLINSDISVNFGQKLDNNNSNINSYGVKPLTAAMVIAGYFLDRFAPPTVVPVLPSGGIINDRLTL
ncbi:RHS repeat-associated core domain-containing protein [Chryseobacterium sp. G0201]|uniref:RHS repeat-associated core domain-containing protein n=1 Tax=Chryseobacterium sp. G0201 TaxID=2487065 RepID=UPI000F4E0102|nr:RHS repeat-associated core domain-containing protein [Chryseobacterium sp. G0201]AZA51541.1 hypothetical protein EG348_00245 [Chryseobacterium sp. G0201]